ncbi:MAG: hypothetical protein IPJ03_19930 [Ignavibacteriales bacterium]|nr:hypothetical protein [Ignavibacteriales bacterium]MBK7381220.1 hypothetical protein [Ignavibacteriales bacterium]
MSFSGNKDSKYLHIGLYAVIVVLILLLIKVAIIDPNNLVESEKYFKTETRLRMTNIKEAELLYQKKFNRFTDNLDELINFVKSDPMVQKVITGVDSISKRPSNPFKNLTNGVFAADSLLHSPKSFRRFIVMIDTSSSVDTVVNQFGKVKRIDTTVVVGSRYYIEDTDGYGTLGSLTDEALKNTASWE